MEIIIVRHGETDWNAEDRIQGRVDRPLNEKGVGQAEKTAELLKDEKITRIYSSDFERAAATAEIINQFHNLEISQRPDLREVDMGELDGWIRKDAKKWHADFYEKRKKDRFNVPNPGGGESYADMQERLKGFIGELKGMGEDEKVLVACHQGLGRTLVGTLAGMSDNDLMAIEFPNCCAYFVDMGTGKVSYDAGEGRTEGWIRREVP